MNTKSWMAVTPEHLDQMIAARLERMSRTPGDSITRIARDYEVGERRVRNIRDGISMNHHEGRRIIITPEIESFIETNLLADARLSDEEMRDLVSR